MFNLRHYWDKCHSSPLLVVGGIVLGGVLWTGESPAVPPVRRAPSRQEFAKLEARALELVATGAEGTDRALPYFRRMVEYQPYNERALYFLALALLHRKKVGEEEYRKNCREAIRLLENCVELQRRFRRRSRSLGLRYFYLGMAYWFGGDLQRAIKAFRNSYQADFERLDAVYNEYSILEEQGRSGEAAEVRNRYEKLSRFVNIDD